MQRVGEDGLISVEEAKSSVSELEIVEGLQIDKGIFHLIVKNGLWLEMPYILIYDQKISSLNSLLPLLEAVVQSNKSLLMLMTLKEKH